MFCKSKDGQAAERWEESEDGRRTAFPAPRFPPFSCACACPLQAVSSTKINVNPQHTVVKCQSGETPQHHLEIHVVLTLNRICCPFMHHAPTRTKERASRSRFQQGERSCARCRMMSAELTSNDRLRGCNVSESTANT